MTKKEIDDKINVDELLLGDLGEIRSRIDTFIQKYGPHAILDIDSGYETVIVYLRFKRLETDSEYTKRMTAEAATARLKEQRRQTELKKLRKLANQHGYTLSPKLK